MIGARPIGNDLALHHALPFQHNRLLVDAGVLVGALELGELINVATNFARKLSGMVLAFNADNDAFGVHGIDDAIASSKNNSARIACSDSFHSRANNGS